MKHRNSGIALFIAAFLLVLPVAAFAGGTQVPNQDAKADGMGLAAAASIDNPSAIYFNPALLTNLKGFSASIGVTTVIPYHEFTGSASGVTTSPGSTTHFLPNLFAAYTRGDFSYGLGVYMPFGLSSSWPTSWEGRATSTYSQLQTIFVNPTIAYRVNDRVSVGFGLDFVNASLTSEQALLFGAQGQGRSKMTGSGNGIGANAGVAIKLPRDYTFAFTARTPIDIEYNGSAKFFVPNPALTQMYPALRNTRASMHMTLPAQLGVALAKKISDLTLETDVRYTMWSSSARQTVRYLDNRPLTIVRQDWHDAFTFCLGANYAWTKKLETQAGYIYDMSPVPTRTMGPSIPLGGNAHMFTTGAGYDFGPVKVNAAYQMTLYEGSSSRNNLIGAPRGSYDNLLHTILLTFSYHR